METYDFSAFAAGNAFGGSTGSTDGMSGSGGAMSGFGGGMGGGTNGFGSGMGGGTNSFGSGMSSGDMEGLFEQSPWGGLNSVGFTSLEQVFRGNAGGNLQRSDGGSTSGSAANNQGGDSLLAGGDGNTSASGYSYNFSSFS